MNHRIIGYDVARAFACLGMIIVNFKLIMNAAIGNPDLLELSDFLQGRGAALFVILAGVGISLMSKSARLFQYDSDIKQVRSTLIKRGVVLILFGLIFTFIWPADILHFYGSFFLMASFLVLKSSRALLHLCLILNLAFVAFVLLFNYETGWHFETLTYEGFWSVKGMFRHLFFNGFHPIFPWFTFLLVGMILGRLDLSRKGVKRWLVAGSMIIWLAVESLSEIAIYLTQLEPEGLTQEDIISMFGTSPMPPMPLYLLSAASSAIIIICFCVAIAQKWQRSVFIKALERTGKCSLTLYVAHILIGVRILEFMGYGEGCHSINKTFCFSFFFFVLSIIGSFFWLKYQKQGPLEKCLRLIA